MAYERQINEHLDRLDQSFARLHTMIKRGENKAASRYMLEGELKDRFEDLRNIINIQIIMGLEMFKIHVHFNKK
jgi:hypothetical protein